METLIRVSATALGLLALGLPLVRVWGKRGAQRGRSSGASTSITRWPAVFGLAIAYVTIGVLLWRPVPIHLSPSLASVFTLVGALLYFPGIFLYGWGFFTIGAMFGVASGMGAQLYQEHRLVRDGPYAFVRHPMYLGVLLVALGALLIFRTWAMVLFTPMAFGILLRARREEALLEQEFGDQWIQYRHRVPGWIPRLRRK